MPPLETIGLEAVFDTKEFTKGQRIYERGLARVDSSTTKTAQSLTSAWGDSTAGLEDMFAQLDEMGGKADEVAGGLAALEGGAITMSAGMVAASIATAGVVAALAAVAAVGTAIWNKIDDAAMEYLARSKEVIKVQEKVNEEWDKASRHLAQTLIPLKVELLNIELALAEITTGVIRKTKKMIAILHAGLAGLAAAQMAILPTIGAVLRGEISSFEEIWERIAGAGEEQMRKVARTYLAAFEETFPEVEDEVEDNWDKIVDAINDALNRIEDLQIAYNRRVADLEADALRRRVRAFAKFQANFRKQVARGQAALAKITDRYEKRRAKTIASFQKRIDKARAKIAKAHVKAQEDYERRERHTRERFQLDMLQSERRYQSQRGWLVAEGDTLAIERLDELYKIQQEEAEENEALRQRQARESQVAQIREAGEAAREQIDELRQQLAEALDEQEASYLEQVATQKQANINRLVEMTVAFQEQQRLQDEDDALALQKAEVNYQRQLEDLGRNLARQEELQELGAEEVERLLNRFYGEDGTADRIMEGWHERENARILVTAALMTQMAKWPPLMPGGIPMPGQTVGMQMGGVLEGPAMAYVEPGVTEAFIPLTGPGAGGSFTHEFLNALNITGLEGASQMDVSALAKALAKSLTRKVRTRRRG